MPLYKINSSGNRAADALDRAAGSFSRMQSRDSSKSTGTQSEPGKTAGGAITSGAGTAMGGYMVGSAVGSSTALSAGGSAAAGAQAGSTGGYWGAAIGAVVGIAAYLLS